MAPVQTTYGERMLPPSPGTIAGSDFNTKTGTCEEAAGIGFGKPVSQGVNSDKGVALAGALADFLGISVRDIAAHRLQASVGADEYSQYSNMGYLSRGQIWVEASVAVEAGDPVHFNATTGVWLITGGTGPIPGARYVTSGGAGDRVLVELGATVGG